jgi:S-formylglutathione hydrolase FrmB
VGDVADTEDTLVAEDKMRPLVLVMPDGSVSYLVDEEWANGIRRRSAWETFVARDLVNTIDNRYRVITTGSGRAIGGLSEGGYGALNIGLQHIGEFRVLESWSGYMEADPIPAIFGKSASALRRNSPALEVAKDVARVRAAHTYIWFYCGTDDFTVPQNRQFNAELSRLEVPHWFAIRPGQHTWRLWRSMMPASLETASAHLSHA